MPITSSAKKALRRSKKQQSTNNIFKHGMKKAITTVRRKVKKSETVEASDLSAAYSAIDKALKQGIIKKNTASRRKSRLSLFVAKAAK